MFPFGSFKNNGAYFEGDIAREEKPKVMLASTFSYNNKAENSQGQTGTKLLEAKTFTSLMIDGIVKYNGWAGMISYMNRKLSNPIASVFNVEENKTDYSYVYAGEGMDYQLSYLFPSNYELIGRVSTQTVNSQLRNNPAINLPNTTQFTVGATKYLWEHAFKLQAEFTYDQLSFANNPSKDNWYFRLQFEIGI